MQDFFETLYHKELKRAPSKFYTLGDEESDILWGLNQNVPTFTPPKDVIDDFASMSYLYGLLGYTAENYTALPAGYLVSYKKGNDVATVVISPGTMSENISKLEDEISAHLKNSGLTSKEREFFDYVATEIKNKNLKLLDICLSISTRLQKELDLKHIENRVSLAQDQFDCNVKNSVNAQNCDNNHLLLERICRDLLGYPVEDDQLTKEQRQEAYDLSRKILNGEILPSYLTYVGKNRQGEEIPRDTQVLTRKENLMRILDIVKTTRKMSVVLTMCATDYTADVVCDIMKEISNCKKKSASRKNIDTKINPPTPAHYSRESQARREIRSHSRSMEEKQLD